MGQATRDREHPIADEALRLARALGVDETSAEAHRRQRERLMSRLPSAKRSRLLVLAGALAGAAALFAFRLEIGEPRAPTHLTHVEPATAAEGGERGARWLFSDGSSVEMPAETRLAITRTDPDGAELTLEEGQAALEIMPRAPSRPARWAVRAGAYAVEVHGTRFSVHWAPAVRRLEVALHKGSVRVVGPGLGDGVTLAPGHRFVVDEPTGRRSVEALGAPPTPAPLPQPAAPPVPHPPERPAPARAARPAPSPWPQLVGAGRYDEVVRSAEALGVARCLSRCPEGELRALADAARLARRYGLAEEALLATRQRFGGTLSGRTATFLVGRLYEEARSDPERALAWYDRYLTEAPDDAYAADALGRKMMLLRRAGDVTRARQAADEYLRRFPGGPYAAPARQLQSTR